MAALVFPASPNAGDKFPVNPGTSGVTQYEWDGAKWNAVLTAVSLGAPNQGVFNSYKWPTADGPAGYQLQTDGAGNLSWALEANNNIEALGITPLPDGVNKVFTLVKLGTFTAYTPVPTTNLIVFLGGVPQIPNTSYAVVADQISFTDAPPAGTTFYGISNTVII
jgi:hypothetical protein